MTTIFILATTATLTFTILRQKAYSDGQKHLQGVMSKITTENPSAINAILNGKQLGVISDTLLKADRKHALKDL